MQRVNIWFYFTNNILKQYVKLFHEVDLIVLSKSLYCSLKSNIKVIIYLIIEKM